MEATTEETGWATTGAGGGTGFGGTTGAAGADVIPPGASPGITPSGAGVGGAAGAAAGFGGAGATSFELFLLNKPIRGLLLAFRNWWHRHLVPVVGQAF